jgi:hypothetical protein
MEPVEYMLNRDNNLIFAVHPLLVMQSSYVAYNPTPEELAVGHKLTPAPAPVAVEEVAPEPAAKKGK